MQIINERGLYGEHNKSSQNQLIDDKSHVGGHTSSYIHVHTFLLYYQGIC